MTGLAASPADRDGVRRAIERVVDAVSREDWAGVAAAHEPDAVWERRRPTHWAVSGAERIASLLRSTYARAQVVFRVVSVVRVDLADPWTAAARCRVSEVLRDRFTGASLHLVGTYEDELMRRGGGWLIRRRVIDLGRADFLRGRTSDGRIPGPVRRRARVTPMDALESVGVSPAGSVHLGKGALR